MESAVRGARIEPAIVTARFERRFHLPQSMFPGAPKRYQPPQPCCRERNFRMQRREAEIRLREHEFHQRPAERNDTGRNPHTNGLFSADPKNCGLVGLDGGRTRARTWDPMIKTQKARTTGGRRHVATNAQTNRTSFAPETTSPKHNECDQYPTKMQQNQRWRPLPSRS
jgi:hypothetical protein